MSFSSGRQDVDNEKVIRYGRNDKRKLILSVDKIEVCADTFVAKNILERC